jgi:hypothetical protein
VEIGVDIELLADWLAVDGIAHVVALLEDHNTELSAWPWRRIVKSCSVA